MSTHLTPEELEQAAQGAAPEPSHLQGCAQCRAAVQSAKGRQRLMKGLKPYTLSEAAFSRVEARLMEQVRDNPPGRFSLGRLAVGLAFAALVAFVAVTALSPLLRTEPLVELTAAAFEPLTVVYASGEVKVSAGDVLGPGARLDAEHGTVVLATADGEALRLSAGGVLTLGERDATVRLERGRLSVDARRGGPWVVNAGGHWVKGADAAFDVAPDTLDLHRGSVLLADDARFSRARRLTAPAHLRLSDGTVRSELEGAPLPATPRSPWARLELDWAAAAVELDGASVGSGPLSLLASPGKHHLRAQLADGWREVDVELTTGGAGKVVLPERAPVTALPAPPQPHVEADPQALAAAVKAQLPKLKVCHEKWLKVDEHARGKVLMRLTVAPSGKVTKTSFDADEGVPETVNACLARAARSLKLPPSSEEVELELPVMLGAGN